MKADPFQIGDVLKNPKRFIVPIYQRSYAWKPEEQLATFFDQVEAKANERIGNVQTFPHYMGALLVSPRGSYSFGQLEVVDVVDGQQRLTTFQVFICALRHVATSQGLATDSDVLKGLLVNPDSPLMRDKKNERFKLHPTPYDRAIFQDLVDLDLTQLRQKHSDSFYKNGAIKEQSRLPLQAFMFFRERAQEFLGDGNPEEKAARFRALVNAALEDFRVIMITLDERDDAQVIFETLNSGGKPLAAMDLVRNDVFHRATKASEDVEQLLQDRWSLFESDFWKQEGTRGRIKKPRIDFFLSDTLAAETGQETLLTELYARYKQYVRAKQFSSVDAELEVLLRHAPTFQVLTQPLGNSALEDLARELALFDVRTAYPLVFVIAASDAPEELKAGLYKLVASYIVRRALCGLTTKDYNKGFLRLATALRERGVSPQSFSASLSSADTARFPDDAELRRQLLSREQYSSMRTDRLRYVLSEIEVASRTKFDESGSLQEDLTIEHILPDRWEEHWPLGDGTLVTPHQTALTESQLSSIQERDRLKHTIGNLTLLTGARNPSLGNGGFNTKRAAFAHSLLKMNKELSQATDWGENSIKERGARMAEIVIKIWPALPA